MDGFGIAVVILYRFIAKDKESESPNASVGKIEMATTVAGCVFALAHLLMSIMVAMATYVGSNPACATATLANDYPAGNGLLAIAYTMVFVGVYTFVITPAVPYHLTDADVEDLTGKESPDQPTGLPYVGKIDDWGEPPIHNM